MLFRYFRTFLSWFPIAPITTGKTFVFTFHVGCVSILRSLYFKPFSCSYLITYTSPEIAICINQTCFFIIVNYLVLYIHVTVHRNKFIFNNQTDVLIIQIYSVIKLYMFRASSVPIISSFLLPFGTA